MPGFKAKRMKMTATTSTGAVFTATITMEADGGDIGETLGGIQSNFLWELFDFKFEDIDEIVLPAGTPINCYDDVVQVK